MPPPTKRYAVFRFMTADGRYPTLCTADPDTALALLDDVIPGGDGWSPWLTPWDKLDGPVHGHLIRVNFAHVFSVEMWNVSR